MIPDFILFFGLAIVALASAIGLLLSKSAIYAALNLIINFTAIAFFYLVLSAPFIALTQIAVYAGAIMVLFLFVIMLLGAEKLERGTIQPWQRPAAIILAGILIAEAIYMSIAQVAPAAIAGDLPAEFGTPLAIGETLFNEYLLPFEVVSILLLAAMIGAIVLTKKGGLKRS